MRTIKIRPERDLHMAHENGVGSLEHEVAELRDNQRELVNALKMLFELLEEYAPSWYTEEHHKQADAALQLPL